MLQHGQVSNNNMLDERSQILKNTYSVIPFMWNSGIGKLTYGDQSQIRGCSVVGGLTGSGHNGTFQSDENVLSWTHHISSPPRLMLKALIDWFPVPMLSVFCFGLRHSLLQEIPSSANVCRPRCSLSSRTYLKFPLLQEAFPALPLLVAVTLSFQHWPL